MQTVIRYLHYREQNTLIIKMFGLYQKIRDVLQAHNYYLSRKNVLVAYMRVSFAMNVLNSVFNANIQYFVEQKYCDRFKLFSHLEFLFTADIRVFSNSICFVCFYLYRPSSNQCVTFFMSYYIITELNNRRDIYWKSVHAQLYVFFEGYLSSSYFQYTYIY